MLQALKLHHNQVIQMAFAGFSREEIAEKLDISVGVVTNVLNSDLGKAKLKAMQDKSDDSVIDVRKRLAEMNNNALKVIDNCLTNVAINPAIALKAAESVLDRNGYKPHIVVQNTSLHLTLDDIIAIKERANNAGSIIDISPDKEILSLEQTNKDCYDN